MYTALISPQLSFGRAAGRCTWRRPSPSEGNGELFRFLGVHLPCSEARHGLERRYNLYSTDSFMQRYQPKASGNIPSRVRGTSVKSGSFSLTNSMLTSGASRTPPLMERTQGVQSHTYTFRYAPATPAREQLIQRQHSSRIDSALKQHRPVPRTASICQSSLSMQLRNSARYNVFVWAQTVLRAHLVVKWIGDLHCKDSSH